MKKRSKVSIFQQISICHDCNVYVREVSKTKCKHYLMLHSMPTIITESTSCNTPVSSVIEKVLNFEPSTFTLEQQGDKKAANSVPNPTIRKKLY